MTDAPPADVYAERLVIASMVDHTYDMLAGDSGPHLRVLREVADSGLSAADFTDRRCFLAFAGIAGLVERGWPVTAETVWRFCRRSKNPEHWIDWAWFAEIDRELGSVYGVGFWASRVRDMANKRRVKTAGELVAAGDGDGEKALALFAELYKQQAGAEAVTRAWPAVGVQA